jgi:hypothetical protein
MTTALLSTRGALFLAFVMNACASRGDGQANGPTHDPEGVVVPGQVPVAAGWDVYPAPAAAALPPVPRSLAIPSIVPGELQSGDMVVPEDSGRVADHYIVQLTAGQSVTFVARGGVQNGTGSSIDLMLFLYRNRTLIQSDDDSASDGSALNPRIVFTPTESGTYVLRVTSYGGDFRQGSYTLQTYSGALESQM